MDYSTLLVTATYKRFIIKTYDDGYGNVDYAIFESGEPFYDDIGYDGSNAALAAAKDVIDTELHERKTNAEEDERHERETYTGIYS